MKSGKYPNNIPLIKVHRKPTQQSSCPEQVIDYGQSQQSQQFYNPFDAVQPQIQNQVNNFLNQNQFQSHVQPRMRCTESYVNNSEVQAQGQFQNQIQFQNLHQNQNVYQNQNTNQNQVQCQVQRPIQNICQTNAIPSNNNKPICQCKPQIKCICPPKTVCK